MKKTFVIVQINQSAMEELKRHREDDLRILDVLEEAMKSLAIAEFEQGRGEAVEAIDRNAPAGDIVEMTLTLSDERAVELAQKFQAIEKQIDAYRKSPTLAAALRDLGFVDAQLNQLNEIDWEAVAADLQGQMGEVILQVQELRTSIETRSQDAQEIIY